MKPNERAKRLTTLLRVEVTHKSGTDQASMRNASETGALLHGIELDMGEIVTLSRAGIEVEATVVRVANAQVGVAFEGPVDIQNFMRDMTPKPHELPAHVAEIRNASPKRPSLKKIM